MLSQVVPCAAVVVCEFFFLQHQQQSASLNIKEIYLKMSIKKLEICELKKKNKNLLFMKISTNEN